jgi:hypothetical protein
MAGRAFKAHHLDMSTMEQAREMARATAPERNRYVDFLRAASILVVVIGHWLIMAPLFTDAGLTMDQVLTKTTWTHYLTWIVQVMPVFFFVGGFSNAASWRSAVRSGVTYSAWLRGRLRRLILPVMPLLVVWGAGALILLNNGFDRALLGFASQAALVPVWFLAAYLAVVSLTPLTLRLWDRFGFASLLMAAALAALCDVAMIGLGIDWAGYLNYVLVWGTVHSLGYAWADGRIGGIRARLLTSIGGFVAAGLLVALGPYPVAMVGFHTTGINNSHPPKITLVALALFQIGLLLALESRARRMLAKDRYWVPTVLINGRIMTLYLWHLTAAVVVMWGATLLDGWGLHLVPNSAEWWLTRPIWVAVLALATAPLVMAFGRYERPGPDHRPAPPLWRPILAVLATCSGLAILARNGIADGDGLNGVALSLPFAAAVAGGVGGARLWQRSRTRHNASGHLAKGKAMSQPGSSGPMASQSAK